MNPQGVLLVNLGSPASPALADVRQYLRRFLMDRRVVDLPWPLRICLVHFIIVPFRARRSAECYRRVWLPEGAPLVVFNKQLEAALQRHVSLPVRLAMRYTPPSIDLAVGQFAREGVTELLVVPMFPHYARSSYATAVEEVRKVVAARSPTLRVRVQPPYYEDPHYVAALLASAQECLRQGPEHLLFSFHGLPERQVRRADPTGRHCLRVADCCRVPSPAHQTCYRAQCFKTVEAFLQQSGFPPSKCSVAFQSRLGWQSWLKPYTNEELGRLARRGVKRLLVICPSFVVDCLETLEEIGIRGRGLFLAAGGEDFALAPCLNSHPRWVEALAGMVADFAGKKW
jgi:ferrochelatase